MKLTDYIPTDSVQYEQSLRNDEVTVVTSSNAGKIVPFKAIPLLREDRVQRGVVRVGFDMTETAQKLMNGVNVAVYAHFIPYLAFERFSGMDVFNASYKGEPVSDGEDVVPFFQTAPFDNTSELAICMGLHAKNGEQKNNQIIEAYNTLVNYRRKARSKHLPERQLDDTTLARCFWHNSKLGHIVPDFDDALIDGEVPIDITAAKLPVKGIGVYPFKIGNPPDVMTSEGVQNWDAAYIDVNTPESARPAFKVDLSASQPVLDVYAELEQNGISLSLSNIELAKKTAAFAKLRKRYEGIDDEYLIDLLMDGVRAPEVPLSQPMLLDKKTTLFGYNRRYATDSGNLDKSVTTGETFVDLVFRTPPMNTGGIILLTYEISPDQLWERQEDICLEITDVEELPATFRDYADPQKVDRVPNSHVDVLHSDPDKTFGYAPLNHRFKRRQVNLGGKYYRPGVSDPFTEDRQKIWALEKIDPTLSEDFYLCSDLHYKPFSITSSDHDHFEVMALGDVDIIGNTQFGRGLMEAGDDYKKLLEQVDQERLEGDGTEEEDT